MEKEERKRERREGKGGRQRCKNIKKGKSSTAGRNG